jgi:predicted DNA-binding transcriptional regulator AlpA
MRGGKNRPNHISACLEAGLLIDARGLAALLGLSRNTVWKLSATGRLGPRPIHLGRCVRWRVAEVKAWVDAACPPRGQWPAQG